MPVNKFPLPILEAKQTGSTQGQWKNLLTATDLRSSAFDLDDTREISGGVRRYQLNNGNLPVTIVRCSAL
jgi:hypothetical protein